MNFEQLTPIIQSIHRYLSGCGEPTSSLSKSDRSPVTVADLGIQVLINRHLLAQFPGDGVVAEEHSSQCNYEILERCRVLLERAGVALSPAELREALDYRGRPGGARRWFVDPIDGTKGYLRGGQFVVAIGRFEGDHPQLGCMICPRLSFPTLADGAKGTVLFWERGVSAFQCASTDLSNRRSLTPPTEVAASIAAAPVMVQSFETSHGDLSYNEALRSKLGLKSFLEIDSQAKYAVLARREASVFLRVPRAAHDFEKLWDHGAGVALVQAAGGKVTDMLGNPLRFAHASAFEPGAGVLATIGIDHERVVSALAELRRQRTSPSQRR